MHFACLTRRPCPHLVCSLQDARSAEVSLYVTSGGFFTAWLAPSAPNLTSVPAGLHRATIPLNQPSVLQRAFGACPDATQVGDSLYLNFTKVHPGATNDSALRDAFRRTEVYAPSTAMATMFLANPAAVAAPGPAAGKSSNNGNTRFRTGFCPIFLAI
jgi:hypothetical protein